MPSACASHGFEAVLVHFIVAATATFHGSPLGSSAMPRAFFFSAASNPSKRSRTPPCQLPRSGLPELGGPREVPVRFRQLFLKLPVAYRPVLRQAVEIEGFLAGFVHLQPAQVIGIALPVRRRIPKNARVRQRR